MFRRPTDAHRRPRPPSATRRRPGGKILGIVVVALAASILEAWPVAATGGTPAATPSAPQAGRQAPAYDDTVALRRRRVRPREGVDQALLREVRGSGRRATHAVVQLRSLPRAGRDDVGRLRALGLDLQGYLGSTGEETSTAYVARLDKAVAADDPDFRRLVRAVIPLEAGDKLHEGVLATRDDENLGVMVTLFADAADQAGEVFARHGLTPSPLAPPTLWTVRAPASTLRRLAGEDAVEWIEPGPGKHEPTLSEVRAALNVDGLQNLNTATGAYGGLSGAGTQIAVMDTGVDTSHNDFAGRRVRVLDDGGDHGTHVAGIAAGSGAQSNQNNAAGNPNGGTAFQWRGVAPQAGVLAYPQSAASTADWSNAIALGADVSNHSYVLHDQGLYNAEVALVDRAIRGDVAGIPARPAVWAAANNGAASRSGDCDGNGTKETGLPQYPTGECPAAYQVGYFSVLGPCKNCIGVGSIDKSGVHVFDSSMGPTMDGRLKPEVVAVGESVMSAGADTDRAGNATTGNGYRVKSGTSMAAPAVTGTIALLMEQFQRRTGFNPNPLQPALWKAVLVQTAQDLAGTDYTINADNNSTVTYGAGPDWATGYGLVDAQAAADLVDRRGFATSSVSFESSEYTYPLGVVPGQTEVKVSLAWDDLAGASSGDETAKKLVNDLDLTLIEPNGTTRHYPLVRPTVKPRDCDANTAGIQAGTCAGLDGPQNYEGAATTGIDRVNNVEQVVVRNPTGLTPGQWKVRVSVLNSDGTVRLPQGGSQQFSLAGVAPTADVAVDVIDAPDPARDGDTITYTSTVRNLDAFNDAPAAKLVIQLPAGLPYQTTTTSTNKTCVYNLNHTVDCPLGTLAKGAVVTVTTKVTAQNTGVHSAVATLYTTAADDNAANNKRVVTTEVRSANDHFGSASILSGDSGARNGSTLAATKEPGEPNHGGLYGGHSIWYRWTAERTGRATFTTCGSNFDTVLAAYTGTSVSALTPVPGGANDDSPACGANSRQSSVTFDGVAGQTYQIAVDGPNGASGLVTLTWALRPPNDDFARAAVLSGHNATATGTNRLATREPGEPNHAGVAGDTSVWYRWMSPSTGSVEIETCGSNFDTLLAVYTGTAVNALGPPVAQNDNPPIIVPGGCGSAGQSRLRLNVTQNATYRIAVAGKSGAQGTVGVSLALRPTNDSFAGAQTLTVTPLLGGAVDGFNVGATKEAGEPDHAGNSGGASVWYRWTAPADGTAEMDTCFGTSFDTLLAVYTGSSVTGLTPVPGGSNDDTAGCGATGKQSRVRFTAKAGTSYAIAVDGYRSWTSIPNTGTFYLTWLLRPANDDVDKPKALPGRTGVITGTNTQATKQPGESWHGHQAGGTSVWYRWTAEASGRLEVTTCGSGFDTLLAVYRETTPGAMPAETDTAGENDDDSSCGAGSRQSKVVVPVQFGRTYLIAVDGYQAAYGPISLRWALRPANDDFANAQVITGPSGSVTGSNLNATKQTGEPTHAGNPGGASVWYRWTAPGTGLVQFNTCGSSFDTLLGVYQGSSVTSLTPVALGSNDDDPFLTCGQQSRVQFLASSGQTYWIAVDGWRGLTVNGSTTSQGNVSLNWNPALVLLPL